MTHPNRLFYLCPPDYYQIEYAINPWMDLNNRVQPERAMAQWQTLYDTYCRLGVHVEIIPPEPGRSEMTFPGDSIFLFGKTAISSRFRHPEREPEVAPMAQRFAERGYTIHTLPPGLHFEGNAEAIYFHGKLFCGYGIRSDHAVFAHIGQLLNVEAHTFQLAKPFYHFDVTFCPIDRDLAVYYPGAFTLESAERLRSLFPQMIEVEEAEAQQLGCNSVSVNGVVVMSTPRAPKLATELRARGQDVIELDLSEFYKAGGGAKCLTLEAYRPQAQGGATV